MRRGWALLGLGFLFVFLVVLDWASVGSSGRSFFLEWVTDGSMFRGWSIFWEWYGDRLLWTGGFLLLAGASFFFGIRQIRGGRLVLGGDSE